MLRKEKTMNKYRGAKEFLELVPSTIQAAIERSKTKGDIAKMKYLLRYIFLIDMKPLVMQKLKNA